MEVVYSGAVTWWVLMDDGVDGGVDDGGMDADCSDK